MYKINSDAFRSQAYNSRVRFLILHYTAGNFASSIEILTGGNVSAHYLVPDPSDSTYNFDELQIFNLVSTSNRAWHAGVSNWGVRSNLNDQSIGIEIVNQSYVDSNKVLHFLPYNDNQIDAVIFLCKYILSRYSNIEPMYVLGHSDIAPGRKSDPGAKFPWHKLYQHGIGAWYEQSAVDKYIKSFNDSAIPDIKIIQEKLLKYGYHINVTGYMDLQTERCIAAFQMHFRAAKYDGKVDAETVAILFALLDKYYT